MIKKSPGPDREWSFFGKWDLRQRLWLLEKITVGIDDPALLGEPKLAVFLGNEGDGLLSETIEYSDYRVCIPMSHGVDSLNVAAASAVAFWELGKAK